ncbi:multidrug effflux MFS transporter [Propionicicella superfundia]|uniref:multidrug effflux MFS transporter n=1 Tax=Propionicicella superfundia TaxID=348582 RepID=UPI0003FF0B25|nr:multidrug effflux MFS transporter [Propionicicella superfundia]
MADVRQWWELGPAAGAVALTLSPAVLATIALLGAVAPLATDLYLPVFPQVAAEFGTSSASVQLTLTVFMIGMGIGQLCWGPISDRFGRRRPLIIAGALFVVASVIAPMSGSIGVLVAARFLQGFTGSVGPVLGRAIARDLAHGVELAKALSVLGIITGLAPIAAPVLGGVLAEPVGWRGILWVLAGISVVMLACAASIVGESLPAGRRVSGGLGDVGRSIRTVLTDRVFVGYVLTQAFGLGVLFAFISGSSFVLQTEYGLGSLHYSLLFALNALVLIVGGLLNNRLVVRHSPKRILVIGLLVSVVAAVAAATITGAMGHPPLWVLLFLVALASACNAPVLANTTTLGLDRHGANAGMASAVMGAVQSAVAGGVAQLVAITGQTSAVSMTLVMGGSAVAAGAAYLFLCRRGDATA